MVMENLARLRSLMTDSSYAGKPLQAYVVPNADAHQTPYIPDEEYRTYTISGFFALQATSLVTHTKALVWTTALTYDAAMRDIDHHNWTPLLSGLPDTLTISEFLIQELPADSRVGVNPRYISIDQWKTLKKALNLAGHDLIPVSRDLIDVIREEQGIVFKSSKEKIFVLDTKYTGKSWQEKIKDLREDLVRKRVFGVLVSNLDEVAWLFNLRGNDIRHNFVFFSYAIITAGEISLFVDEEKLTPEVRIHLCLNENGSSEVKVNIRPYEDIEKAVAELSKTRKTIWMSPEVSAAVGTLVDENCALIEVTPSGRRKAYKNPVEVQGMKDCHIRDAVALCEFWSWLEKEVPRGHVTEVMAADKQEEFCKLQVDFLDNSFTTHSFFGDGITRKSLKSSKIITDKGLYFNASGRHYRDGTTNVSRAIHYGTPSQWHQECYTRVLKGHINIAKVVFPTYTTGHALDAFARKALWEAGLDHMLYTGHGVGHGTHVVEGPYGICRVQNPGSLKWGRTSYVPLPFKSGMFVSVEPGHYEEEEKFKFRLENIFVASPVELKNNHKNRGFLKLEPVSFVPFSRKMLMMSLMTKEEIEWLNSYHAECLSRVAPILKEQGKKEALDWLITETKPI